VEKLSVQRVDVQPDSGSPALRFGVLTLGVSRGKNVDVLHLEWAYFDKSWQLPDIQMLRRGPVPGHMVESRAR
jgi:hypothetical protein